MNVKPTMIKLCYTYEKLKSKHEGENKKALQPDKIVEYNDSERNAISIDKADEVIEIETHFRGKYIDGDDKYAFITYVLGFELEGCNSKEYRVVHSVFDVTELNVSVNFESNSYTLIQMEYGRSIFVKLPMFKWRKASYEVCNNIEDAVPGAIVPGSFFVRILNSSNNEVQKSYRIHAKSSISMDDYKELLEDLRRINRELLLNKKAKQFVNFEKRVEQIKNTHKDAFDEISKTLSEIEVPLRNIIKNPKHSIKEVPSKIPVCCIKKYDAKTLIDLKMNSGIEKIRALRHIEDYDIYEHKMIKYALMKLKKFIESLKDDPRYECDSKRAAIKISLDKFKDFLKVENYSEVESKFNEECANLESLCDQFRENKIETALKELMDFLNNYRNLNIDSCKSKKIAIRNYYRRNNSERDWSFYPEVKIEGFVLKISYRIPYVDLEYIGKPGITDFYNRNDKITLASNDLELQEMFYQFLVTRNCKVELDTNKIITRNNKCEEIVLGDNIKRLLADILANNTQHNNIDFYGEIIKNGSDFKKNLSNIKSNMDNAKEEFKKLYGEYIGFENISVDDSEIVNKFKKIEKFLEEKIFKADINTHLKWHPTQIFLNDKNYYAIYKKLTELDTSYKYTDVNVSDEKILLNKMDKLYEYWLWVKMVYLLVVVLGWKFAGVENENLSQKQLIEKINGFLSADEDGQIEIKTLKLTKKLPEKNFETMKANKLTYESVEPETLTLEIKYDEAVDYERGKYNRPDFHFIFKRESDKSDNGLHVYLDAKYRKYENQGGYDSFIKGDIGMVAIKKYIDKYENTKYKSTASFIIHSDQDFRYRYFGGSIDSSIKHKLKEVDCVSNIRGHRFGGFCMLPSDYDDFITFMKMILEYHFFKSDKDSMFYRVCCECGGTEDIIFVGDKQERKSTGGGQPKYKMQCNSCGNIWYKTHCVHGHKIGHKLFKHYLHNFQDPAEDSIWYVKCPDCEFPTIKV